MIATTTRIDWFQVIADLRRKGFPAAVIAQHCGVVRGTVLGWGQGAEPKYADGERLVTLWMRVHERKRDELPTTTGLNGAGVFVRKSGI